MSILDRVVAAVAPLETEEARRKARAKARAAAEGNDWLALIVRHHEQIESAFAAVKAANAATSRRAAQMGLAILLSAHANAEEAVIYPALIHFGHKSHGTVGYMEQAGAKANLGMLEYLNPLNQDFMAKLERIRNAVAHHMYEEENGRFLDLKKLTAADQRHLTDRYVEEYECYMGGDIESPPARINHIEAAKLIRSQTQ